MKCKSCGGEKKHHDYDLWERHQQAHTDVKKYQRQVKNIPPHSSWTNNKEQK